MSAPNSTKKERTPKNAKFELALDNDVLGAIEAGLKALHTRRNSEKDPAALEQIRKSTGRLGIARIRMEKRIALKMAGPKATVDLDDLI